MVDMWIQLSVYWCVKNQFCIPKESNMYYSFEAVIVNIGPGWPQTLYVADDDFEPLTPCLCLQSTEVTGT